LPSQFLSFAIWLSIRCWFNRFDWWWSIFNLNFFFFLSWKVIIILLLSDQGCMQMRRLGCTTINKFGFVTPLTISDWLHIVSLADIHIQMHISFKREDRIWSTCLFKETKEVIFTFVFFNVFQFRKIFFDCYYCNAIIKYCSFSKRICTQICHLHK
jgi:hypothetical protein